MAAAGAPSSLRGAPCRLLLTLLVSASPREPPGAGVGKGVGPRGESGKGQSGLEGDIRGSA